MTRSLALSCLAIALIVVAYVSIPAARHAALTLLCITVIAGMFILTPSDVIRVTAAAALLLIVAQLPPLTAWGSHLDGWMVCVVLPVLGYVAHHIAVKQVRLIEEEGALAQAVNRLEELATRDPMTGLFNQNHMAELITQQAKRSQRAGAPLSMAMIDLDHFRQFNDSHGHEAGDATLAEFARCTLDAVRQTDLVGRWGGEAFVVLFVDTDPAQAALGLARLRERLASHSLPALPTSPSMRLTFSAGLCDWREGDDLASSLHRADEALRAAKQQGRDRVVQAPPAAASVSEAVAS